MQNDLCMNWTHVLRNRERVKGEALARFSFVFGLPTFLLFIGVITR